MTNRRNIIDLNKIQKALELNPYEANNELLINSQKIDSKIRNIDIGVQNASNTITKMSMEIMLVTTSSYLIKKIFNEFETHEEPEKTEEDNRKRFSVLVLEKITKTLYTVYISPDLEEKYKKDFDRRIINYGDKYSSYMTRRLKRGINGFFFNNGPITEGNKWKLFKYNILNPFGNACIFSPVYNDDKQKEIEDIVEHSILFVSKQLGFVKDKL